MTKLDEFNEFDRGIILLHRQSVSEDTPQAILGKVKQIREAIANEKPGGRKTRLKKNSPSNVTTKRSEN
ncbi:hypothetical protein LCAA2362_0451 [Lacticaseibacillus casei A2-362]|nr:hypothetical protein [Lacticaseibacillus paracasei]EKQ05896.1 hypothetical protein LCAA2362_0451 [Lacticaseibacillus casei A2-362]